MLELDLTDAELELMLETLAEKHIILYMRGRDNIDMERLIKKFNDGLKKINKHEIFFKIYKEMKDEHMDKMFRQDA